MDEEGPVHLEEPRRDTSVRTPRGSLGEQTRSLLYMYQFTWLHNPTGLPSRTPMTGPGSAWKCKPRSLFVFQLASPPQVERLPEPPDSSDWAVAVPALDEAAGSLLVTNFFPEQPMPAEPQTEMHEPPPAQVEVPGGQPGSLGS